MSETATTPTLTIRRTFNAPRDRVFTAFTDAGTIRRWFGPPDSTIADATFDARVGGAYRIVMQSPNYGEMVVKGIVTALRRPEHLAYTWRWEEDDAATEHETFVRIDFIDHGATTEMLFVHEGFADEASRDRHQMGWDGAFGKIDTVL